MESLYIAGTAMFSVFAFLALGYLLKRRTLVDETFLKKLNSLVFRVFLTATLFGNIYEAELSGGKTVTLLAFGVGVNVAVFLLLMIFIPRVEPEQRNRGVMVQGAFRGNFLLLGLPILRSIYGHENIGAASALIAAIVPVYNVLSVLALEAFQGQALSRKKLLLGLCRNPLLVAALLAVLAKLGRVPLPGFLLVTLQSLEDAATPLALIVLGGTFRFSQLRGSGQRVALCILCKLILFPAAVVSLAVACGFRGVELSALMVMSASSTAVSSFTMAQQVDANDILAGQIVVATTLCSMLTLFLWILALKELALI